MIGRTNINGTNDASGVGAVLSIDAPIGSTVTISQGSFSKVLKDPIEISTFFSRYFYLIKPNKFGSWTITATDGTRTTDTRVLVTANKEYEVTLSFIIYLFRAGDQCTNITDGWNATGWTTANTSTTAGTIANGKMTIGNVGNSCILATNQAVSFSGRTLLTVELKTLSTYSTYDAGAVDLYDSKGTITATRRFAGRAVPGAVGNHLVTVDLSDLSQTSGFVVVRNGGAVSNYKYEVYNIWLE